MIKNNVIKNMSLKTEMGRNSSFELLRIIAISMIVVHHFLSHGLQLYIPHIELYNFINPFFYGGVDLFFLLSGFFLIKLTLKSALRLIGLVASFCVISFLVVTLWVTPLDNNILLAIFKFPVTSSPYWFVQVYFGLMCLSPLLNAGLKALSNRQLLQLAIVLFLFNSYSCWAGSNMCNDGYSFGQAIYLYILGNCIKRFESGLAKFDGKAYILASVACIMVISILNTMCGNSSFAQYHSPFMVIAMLLFFTGFLKLNIQSKLVNSIASASFGVYLLHEGLLGSNFIYSYLNKMAYSDIPMLSKIGLFVAVFVGFWILSWIITTIFNYLYTHLLYPTFKRIFVASIERRDMFKRIVGRLA